MAEPIKFIRKTGPNPEQLSGGKLVQFRKKPNIHELNDAKFWFFKGVELENSENTINDAIVAYEKVLELNPNYAGAFVNLGCIYYNRRNFEQAEKLYRKATEIDPNYALAWFDLGNVLDETSKLDEAAQAYKRAVEIAPEYADAHYNLAFVFQRQGQNSKALLHWKTYAKLDTTGPWATHARNQVRKIQERLGFQIVGKQNAEEKPLELKTAEEDLHPLEPKHTEEVRLKSETAKHPILPLIKKKAGHKNRGQHILFLERKKHRKRQKIAHEDQYSFLFPMPPSPL